MKSLKGKRTYITLGVLALHQILKANGVDVPDETLSTVLDLAITGLAGYFRSIAITGDKK